MPAKLTSYSRHRLNVPCTSWRRSRGRVGNTAAMSLMFFVRYAVRKRSIVSTTRGRSRSRGSGCDVNCGIATMAPPTTATTATAMTIHFIDDDRSTGGAGAGAGGRTVVAGAGAGFETVLGDFDIVLGTPVIVA